MPKLPLLAKCLLAGGVLLSVAACSTRPKDVPDSKQMTDLLVDMHTLDGIFSTEGYRHFPPDERNKYYEGLLVTYGMTPAQFDSALVWYGRDPKRFEKIYGRVIARLTEEETAVKAGKYHTILPQRPVEPARINLWRDSTHLTLYGDSSARRTFAFTIADTSLLADDLYEFRFRSRVASGDSCPELHMHFNLHYADGRVDSIYLPLPADSLLHRYTLRIQAHSGAKIDSLHGRFLTADTCLCARHTDIDSLSLIRSYLPEMQDTLRVQTRRYEAFRTFPYRLAPMPGEHTDFMLRKRRINTLPR